MSRLLYLYGFVPPGAATPPPTLLGVGEAPARRVDVGGVSAIVGDVPSADYAPDRVEARMRDLQWVGDQGALHEKVVTWFVDHGGILPARLLTLYSGEPALAASVAEGGDAIRDALDRLHGLREWDLKISYRAEELRRGLGAVSDAVAALDREMAGADPGRRYLLERKREKLLDEETGRAARRLGEDALEKLRPLVRESRRVATPRSVEAADLPVVVHAALLVEEAREADLQRSAGVEAAALAAHGFTLALTGPWAPYRFLARETDGGE